jgi:hypothetical protein
VQDFSLLLRVQTGLDIHQWVSGMKQQEREADHSPLSSAEVKKDGAIPPLSDMSSWHSA